MSQLPQINVTELGGAEGNFCQCILEERFRPASVTALKMMRAHGSLDQPLHDLLPSTIRCAPQILPDLVGFKEPSAVEQSGSAAELLQKKFPFQCH